MATMMLGDMRCAAAVPTLLENIDWEYQQPMNDNNSLAGFPCAQALENIGITCVPEMLRWLSGQRVSEVSESMISVQARLLRHLYGIGDRSNAGGPDEAVATLRRFIAARREESTVNARRLLAKFNENPRFILRPRVKAANEINAADGAGSINVSCHDIAAPTSVERGRAYTAWEREERNELRYFIQIADTAKAKYEDNDERYLAVRALEAMRNPAAAEVLVRHLDWQYESPIGEVSVGELDRHPCASALQSMGPGVVPALLNWFRGLHMHETAASRAKRIELAAAVVQAIYHAEGGSAEAIAVVDRYIDKVAPDQRDDLKRIVRLLQENSKM